MKKIYNAPVARVYAVKPSTIIALSEKNDTTITDDNKDQFQQLAPEEKGSSNGLWDKEW